MTDRITIAQLLLIDRYSNKLRGSLNADVLETGHVRISLDIQGRTYSLPPSVELASAWEAFQASADAALRAFRDREGLEL